MDREKKETQDKISSPEIQSIQDLINHVTGKNLSESESLLPAALPINKAVFPFSDLVGLRELKLGLILSIISPNINSLLLAGPSKSGKSTIIQSLTDMLPAREVSLCIHGCLPQYIEKDGMEAVCADCARKFGEGLPISIRKELKIIHLPPNITFEELSGRSANRLSSEEVQAAQNSLLLMADQNILFSGSVQELDPLVLKTILTAAQSKSFQLWHHHNLLDLHTQFTFIGESGQPDSVSSVPFVDSFDLMLISNFPENHLERKKARHNIKNFYSEKQNNPFSLNSDDQTEFVSEIFSAIDLLEKVDIAHHLEKAIHLLLELLGIRSLNAEFILIEASKASAAADERLKVNISDIRNCAGITLRHHLIQSTTGQKTITEIDRKIQETCTRVFPE